MKKQYKLCISGPTWVLKTIKHLMVTYTDKVVYGPMNGHGGKAKHLQVYDNVK